MIPKITQLVKSFFEENKRIPNPYRYYRNENGANVRHPHQLGVILSSNIIFRRINYSVKDMFDHWLPNSELGAVFDQTPYLMRVLNYIHYRSTDFMREGFVLRNKHLIEGTDKLRGFEGDRATFMKHLYVLEKLGVIIIDKRQYHNFVFINYDVVGRYSLLEKHRFRYSDEEVEQWKIDNRIYNLSKLDHRAKLEMLWSYQMGYKAHYDMFDDQLFCKYITSPAKSHDFESGFSDVNHYDFSLRERAFESRRGRILTGNESRPVKDRLPMQEIDFQFGGMMNTGKKHKSPHEIFENMQFDGDTIDVTTLPQKEISIPKYAFHTDEVPVAIEKQDAGEIDWDNVDLADIQWEDVDKRSMNKFKRHLVSYLDDLFVEGLNSSTQAEKNGVKFRKTIITTPPNSPRKEDRDGLRAQYYGSIGSIYNNIYLRLIEEGASDQRIRAFIKWCGKYYFVIHKSDEVKSWFNPDQIVPSWKGLAKTPHENGVSGINNIFFNKYRKALEDKMANSEKVLARVLTPVNDGGKVAALQRENAQLKKVISSGGSCDVEKIKKQVENQYKAKMKAAQDERVKLWKALEDAGVDPLTVM